MTDKKIYTSLTEWRKAEIGSQKKLSDAVGRDQHTISRYENGDQVPWDVEQKLRELGYAGPLHAQKAALKASPDIGSILDEAREIMARLDAQGFKARSPEERHELSKLVAEEVQRCAALGLQEAAADRVERWWKLAEARRK